MALVPRRQNKLVLVAAVLTFIGFLCFITPSGTKVAEADIAPSVIPEGVTDFGSSLGSTTEDSTPTYNELDEPIVSKATAGADAAVTAEKAYVPAFAVEQDEVTTSKVAAKAESTLAAKNAASDITDSKVKTSKPKVESKPLYDQKEEAKYAGEVEAAACDADGSYVVMIDAGSTGSRVHIYKFDTCVSPPKLLNEEFEMLKPGLSSFDTDAAGAALSLDPLMDLALKSVPKAKRACTPVALKATAGLRLLGAEKSKAILAEVRRHLTEDYPFAVVEGDGISIMDGSDEGVYAWITTNYLLGNIGSKSKDPTAAVFDLGGGSTQIVFEPVDGESMIEGEHKYEISFGGRDFTLYQYSHLGYGLMQARKKINSYVMGMFLNDKNAAALLKPLTAAELKDDTLTTGISLQHPCLPPGVRADSIKVEMEDKSTYLVNFVSPAQSATDPVAQTASTQCRSIAESVLNKDSACESKSCSFNGIYQPSLRHQFLESSDMYIFSYFYDRLQPIGMPLSFTLQEMKDITKLVCSGAENWAQNFKDPKHVKELEDEPLWCLDLSFMTAMLHVGYDIPLTRELRTAKTIEDNELGWCLGASLPLLDKSSGWTCKITKDF
ncbi:hypothetical protein CANARDRAFT_5053 [[Candida] arabinofermentans NRRL YB-2248]|uniref:guanosine-diphosphatase n=1 Tax=[Candida] arabinofermentans NRRL YB-2248 TaxID=983967 RepID=A0A1E4T7K2_9ASCO|nr:hypothetical protein CANARDRAFT_5053 [[Candida] arabinofermentans NRRL YB-2248]